MCCGKVKTKYGIFDEERGGMGKEARRGLEDWNTSLRGGARCGVTCIYNSPNEPRFHSYDTTVLAFSLFVLLCYAPIYCDHLLPQSSHERSGYVGASSYSCAELQM